MCSDKARIAIFTICANNYLPAANVLLASAGLLHTNADLFLIVSDQRLKDESLYREAWNYIFADELPISNFAEFAFRYDVMELSTAVKPFVFLHLLFEHRYDQVIYFDPDIEVFQPLTSVFKLLDAGASFVLTPHMLQPGERLDEPNDFTTMRAGTYNLGFMAASKSAETQTLLSWWARRTRYHCINAQERGIFVDQKFVDLMPGFAPSLRISHDSSLNVAYWNLAERRLTECDDRWLIDDKPLTFFHFSGFNPNKPSRLSKHTDRFSEIGPGPLSKLCASYATKLKNNQYGAVPAGSYGFSKFASGTKIHQLVRQMFRDWHTYWPDDPFETYEAFLHQPWPGASLAAPGYVVTNFMKYLYDRLPYLHMRLDLANPENVRELVDWFVKRAASEWHFDLKLVEPAAARLGARRRSRNIKMSACDGSVVSVIGYLRTASGVGEVGRQTLRSLEATGLSVSGIDIDLGVVASRNDQAVEDKLVDASSAPVQIYNVNADQLPAVVSRLEGRVSHNGIRISIPFWELSSFPDAWVPALEMMDEIWAPSKFIQSAIAPKVSRPVIHMPVAIEIDRPQKLPRSVFGLPDDCFLFFYSFDFLSFMERKNPTAVLKSFRKVFAHEKKVGLVIKCMNGAIVPDRLQEFEDAISDEQSVFLLKETMSRSDALSLIDAVDAVVSLHRSEGLGLLIAEAMLLEKPVIATDYAATREFLNDATGYPVDYRLIPVGEGQYPFPQDQIWADADVDHCAWHMRNVFNDQQTARLKVIRAAEHMQLFSRAAVARKQETRLAMLLNT